MSAEQSKPVIPQAQATGDKEDDPFEVFLKGSGCLAERAILRQCLEDPHQPKKWMFCLHEMQVFRDCIEQHLLEKKGSSLHQS